MGLAPSREYVMGGGDSLLPFVSRAAQGYRYPESAISAQGGCTGKPDRAEGLPPFMHKCGTLNRVSSAPATNPSISSTPGSTAQETLYYYEHRLLPFTADFFPSPDCFLFRQLWRARQQQNARYHFHLAEAWSPAAYLDPTAHYCSYEQLVMETITEAVREAADPLKRHSVPDGEVQTTMQALKEHLGVILQQQELRDLPFASRKELHGLLVGVTEQSILFDSNQSLRAAAMASLADTKPMPHPAPGYAMPTAPRIRPLPCAIVLVRSQMSAKEYKMLYAQVYRQRQHKVVAGTAGRGNGESTMTPIRELNISTGEVLAALHQLQSHQLVNPNTTYANLHFYGGADHVPPTHATCGSWSRGTENEEEWLKVPLRSGEVIELRVVGMYGCWTVREVLSRTLFSSAYARPTNGWTKTPDQASQEAITTQLLTDAAPCGVPSHDLMHVSFFEKPVGDKEQAHTFIALCRYFAQQLRLCLNQCSAPAHTQGFWEAFCAGMRCRPDAGGDFASSLFVRFSNLPQLQLCRQIRLFASDLRELYPNPLFLKHVQEHMRQRQQLGLLGAARNHTSTQISGTGVDSSNGVVASGEGCGIAFASQARGGTHITHDSVDTQTAPPNWSSSVLEELESTGVCSYFSNGLLVFRLSHRFTVRAMEQLALLPSCESTEAIVVALVSSSPPVLTYRGELSENMGHLSHAPSGQGMSPEYPPCNAVRYQRDKHSFPPKLILPKELLSSLPKKSGAHDHGPCLSKLPCDRIGTLPRMPQLNLPGAMFPFVMEHHQSTDVYSVPCEFDGKPFGSLLEQAMKHSMPNFTSYANGSSFDSTRCTGPAAQFTRCAHLLDGVGECCNCHSAGPLTTAPLYDPTRVLRFGNLIRFCPSRTPANGNIASSAEAPAHARHGDSEVTGVAPNHAGMWYIDDELHAEDLTLGWMRRVTSRAREAKGCDPNWVQYPPTLIYQYSVLYDIPKLYPAFGSTVPRDLVEGAAYAELVRLRHFRQWRFCHDGYMFFHGVTLRLEPPATPSGEDAARGTVTESGEAKTEGVRTALLACGTQSHTAPVAESLNSRLFLRCLSPASLAAPPVRPESPGNDLTPTSVGASVTDEQGCSPTQCSDFHQMSREKTQQLSGKLQQRCFQATPGTHTLAVPRQPPTAPHVSPLQSFNSGTCPANYALQDGNVSLGCEDVEALGKSFGTVESASLFDGRGTPSFGPDHVGERFLLGTSPSVPHFSSPATPLTPLHVSRHATHWKTEQRFAEHYGVHRTSDSLGHRSTESSPPIGHTQQQQQPRSPSAAHFLQPQRFPLSTLHSSSPGSAGENRYAGESVDVSGMAGGIAVTVTVGSGRSDRHNRSPAPLINHTPARFHCARPAPDGERHQIMNSHRNSFDTPEMHEDGARRGPSDARQGHSSCSLGRTSNNPYVYVEESGCLSPGSSSSRSRAHSFVQFSRSGTIRQLAEDLQSDGDGTNTVPSPSNGWDISLDGSSRSVNVLPARRDTGYGNTPTGQQPTIPLMRFPVKKQRPSFASDVREHFVPGQPYLKVEDSVGPPGADAWSGEGETQLSVRTARPSDRRPSQLESASCLQRAVPPPQVQMDDPSFSPAPTAQHTSTPSVDSSLDSGGACHSPRMHVLRLANIPDLPKFPDDRTARPVMCQDTTREGTAMEPISPS